MRTYIYTSALCRSVMIGKYFGDDQLKPCGICDNCINKKKKDVSVAEFDHLSSTIMNEIKLSPVTMKELFVKLNTVSKDKIKEVLRFLQSEEKVVINDSGKMSLKSTLFPAASS